MTLEVGTDVGLAGGTEGLGAMLDRGLTVLVLDEGRIVVELTDEASASGLVPVGSLDFVIELASGLVAATLGLGALGRGAATGLVGLADGVLVLEDSLDASGRAGGIGGLVLVRNVLVGTGPPGAAGADLGLEPEY